MLNKGASMRILRSVAIFAVSSISTAAFSQQFTYFSYQESGYAGRMLVANELATGSPVQPIAVHIQTEDTGTHHACDVWAMEDTVARVKSNGELSTSMRVVDEKKEPTGETFDVVFKNSTAVVTSSGPSEYCGVSGTFSGNWGRSQEEK
ncbi:hypothetical protein [Pseudomonas aeruginosa]|uniref:hypothetical protein n=1 Tax=Pseudomonas aeruginosa TaxID=287 RepID=UPI004053DE71